ncbi:MAG TPA: hypothetical protein VGX28_11600 [Frankiaceae bacterium]|jgi:hypothetical protein|nr:hypothetical protein [Frankiaceae bacterium]
MPLTPRRLALAAVAAALALPGVAQAACHAEASYCVDNEVTSVSVVTRNGTVEVHRGGWSLTDQFVFCAPEYLAYLRAPERDYEAYAACAFGPDRVL